MRIAVVIERIESWRGGAETSTLELSELLADRGHQVHVLTATARPSTPKLTVHQLAPTTIVRPWRTESFLRRVDAFLQRERYDVVHAIAPLASADVYQPRGGALCETMERNLALRRTAAGRLLKRTTNALNVKYRALLALERRICRPGGPVIAAVSNYVARQFERYYGLTPPRVRVVFNGVAIEPFDDQQRLADRREVRRQYGIADDALVLLCIAHNFRLKGVPRVIDALPRVHAAGLRNVTVLIIGRDNPAQIQRRAMALGVAPSLMFLGPTQRIRAFYHAADVCVHPTYYDPCSRVVLESLARGVPAITTRQNGASEVLREGENGFILESPDDVDALARTIVRAADPDLRRRLAQSAPREAERISMRRHVDELVSLFREISSAPRRHPTTAAAGAS